MARLSFLTDQYVRAYITIYGNTGLRYGKCPGSDIITRTASSGDTYPFSSLKGEGIYELAVNQDAKLSSRYGIGYVDVSFPSALADMADYCIITTKVEVVTGKPSTSEDVFSNYADGGRYIGAYGYYYITGFNELNGGTVRFFLLLDAYTTLGSNNTIYGGFYTRVPYGTTFKDGTKYTENILPEPYTTAFPSDSRYLLLNVPDVSELTGANIVLSPYNLANVIDTNGDINITAASETTFHLVSEAEGGSTTAGATQTYGVAAYYLTGTILKNIAKLYAAGITNPIYRAYRVGYGRIIGGSVSSNSPITDIYGTYAKHTVAIPDKYAPDSITDIKPGLYGKYVTLISLTTGETQTLPLYDCTSDGKNITIDLATDPSPSGCVYARLRNVHEVYPSNIPKINHAFLTGHVTSSPWKDVAVRGVDNDRGVELNQTWRSAEINIDALTSQMNAAATAAQYNLSAGSGYLLKNAGNQYGMQMMSAQLAAQTANYNTTIQQSNANAAIGFAADFSSGLLGTYNQRGGTGGTSFGLAGLAAGGAAGASGVMNAINAQQSAAVSLNNAANIAAVSQQQMADQGAYNTQVLDAQAAAANQIAQATIEKNNLARQKLSSAPSIPMLSQYTGGILGGLDSLFCIVFSKMSDTDTTLFKRSLDRFGVTCYAPVEYYDGSDSNRYSSKKDNAEFPDVDGLYNEDRQVWQYFQIEPDELNYAPAYTNLSGTWPGWMYSAACDQVRDGIFLKRG